MDRGPVTVFSF